MIHLLLDLVNKSLGRHFRFWRFFTHARQTVAREWNYTCPVPRATHLQFWTLSTACGKPFTYVLNTSETWYHLLHSFIVNLSFTCLRNQILKERFLMARMFGFVKSSMERSILESFFSFFFLVWIRSQLRQGLLVWLIELRLSTTIQAYYRTGIWTRYRSLMQINNFEFRSENQYEILNSLSHSKIRLLLTHLSL